MDGILVINKPTDMTSHDVVNIARRKLKTKKIGHTGTLDPNATGVLLLLVGKATKILPFLEDTDKEYIATLALGKKTLSDDVWGEVLEEKTITPIEDFPSLLQKFQGTITQTPPLVSSIKVNGKKLYEYARANEPVEIPTRQVDIYEIECLDASAMKFRVHCGSGTYVRSLCVDIAAASNNLGCMSSLVRTKVGRFDINQATSLDNLDLESMKLYPIKELLNHLQMVEYKPIEEIYHGKKIKLDTIEKRVCITHDGNCIAIYKRLDNGLYGSERGLW
ncbi:MULTISPECIES: tRNA pseudouridine(55) synthase TruB [unclassified Breznakia]|uniref:tRNA pseudouridine(55) synthase TruB n=1 Tax=unclassified Breznakia TaxID=2623764 RepID=UPI002474D880|nr:MULTISPECIES: tRNA pseudouridine(55) synthase TruB [unclassified Breznakia]MDH6366351.1 tRNA pseudouridine55 synthase [Breznakia sp. PH1-1]MDH6403444.1 tRNA pseudouridine55 synthase [Breznakia sp. PF1-11]MDH6411153.1 tRNA pseudouridine55 synthase [Breznakia sp. PFB1-11]MDH6413584.1 tRNA pseudouridine55 synthase [Breznakia sp. PFB1-14]MDH6415698.1 tRNA pseudouridine55 synthase [Breznakia sp. PFB1-4]